GGARRRRRLSSRDGRRRRGPRGIFINVRIHLARRVQRGRRRRGGNGRTGRRRRRPRDGRGRHVDHRRLDVLLELGRRSGGREARLGGDRRRQRHRGVDLELRDSGLRRGARDGGALEDLQPLRVAHQGGGGGRGVADRRFRRGQVGGRLRGRDELGLG